MHNYFFLCRKLYQQHLIPYRIRGIMFFILSYIIVSGIPEYNISTVTVFYVIVAFSTCSVSMICDTNLTSNLLRTDFVLTILSEIFF